MRWTVITNCDSFFITKCDTVYYKLRQVLQSAMNLLQIATVHLSVKYDGKKIEVAPLEFEPAPQLAPAQNLVLGHTDHKKK